MRKCHKYVGVRPEKFYWEQEENIRDRKINGTFKADQERDIFTA